jgi:pilus assembly protein CpaB
LLAIVLAGVATFLLIQYVTSADERAREDEELVEVFVAQGDIAAGTTADEAAAQGLIDTDEIPSRTLPQGAIGDLGQLDGQVAVGPIYDGEVIVSQRFGRTVAAAGGVGLDVPEGTEAVTVEAGVIAGVAGFVQPGDDVSVIATLTLPAEQGDAVEGEADEEEGPATGLTTQYLVQDAEVLAVGQRVVNTGEDGQQTTSIQLSNESYIFTLAMPAEEIEQLVFAYQQGVIHFTVLPELDEGQERELVETPGRSIEDIFDN